MNRDGKKPAPKWEVQFPTSPVRNPEQMSIIPSTPAGQKEDPMEQIAMNEAEDQVKAENICVLKADGIYSYCFRSRWNFLVLSKKSKFSDAFGEALRVCFSTSS